MTVHDSRDAATRLVWVVSMIVLGSIGGAVGSALLLLPLPGRDPWYQRNIVDAESAFRWGPLIFVVAVIFCFGVSLAAAGAGLLAERRVGDAPPRRRLIALALGCALGALPTAALVAVLAGWSPVLTVVVAPATACGGELLRVRPLRSSFGDYGIW